MPQKSASINLQFIVSLCESLTKSGVTPTVGLIKKHANRPLPLPEIIAVLRNWKLDPDQYKNIEGESDETVNADTNTASKTIQTLEARITILEQQMATLLKLQE